MVNLAVSKANWLYLVVQCGEIYFSKFDFYSNHSLFKALLIHSAREKFFPYYLVILGMGVGWCSELLNFWINFSIELVAGLPFLSIGWSWCVFYLGLKGPTDY